MQIHTVDLSIDAQAEYTFLLREFLRSPYPYLTEEQQWAKLALVKEIAEEVWK